MTSFSVAVGSMLTGLRTRTVVQTCWWPSWWSGMYPMVIWERTSAGCTPTTHTCGVGQKMSWRHGLWHQVSSLVPRPCPKNWGLGPGTKLPGIKLHDLIWLQLPCHSSPAPPPQIVCTKPLLGREGPGDEANTETSCPSEALNSVSN